MAAGLMSDELRGSCGGNVVDLRSADRAAINQNKIALSFRHPGMVLVGVQCCSVANWIPAYCMPE